MTDTSGAAAGGGDAFDAEVEAARNAEQGGEAPLPGAVVEPEESGEGAAAAKPAAKAPLEPEEIERRWRSNSVALKQERAAKRELQRQIDELRAQVTAPKPQAETARPAAPPDPSVDPIGAIQHLNERLRAFDGQSAEQQRADAQARAQSADMQRLQSWAAEQEADFTEDTPDYPQAVQHFVKARMAELAEEGYANPQAQLQADLSGLARRAQANGRNFGEMVYKLAQARGFGREASPAAKALEQVAAGQRAANPLASSSGRPSGEGIVTLKRVAEAPDKDFDRLYAQLKAANKGR